MQPWKILTKLLLIMLLALSASGVVSAKVASGPQNLSPGLHQGEMVFNPLTYLAKLDFSTTLTPGSSVVTKGGADNIATARKLANDLRLRSANSPFKTDGTLTNDAIREAREIIPASKIGDPNIPSGFSKFSTQTFQSPSGDFQVRFLKNPKTGEVLFIETYINT